jgi:glutamate-5-semialdehyde dehydrogenase
VLNAKMRRTGVCGAAETLLMDRAGASKMLKPLIAMLIDAGCEIRGDEAVQAVDARVKPASEADWSTEYLDAVITAGVVDGVDAAIAHIERYGSHHTDAIVAENRKTAEKFLREVDSAIVLHNATIRRRRRIRLWRRNRHCHRQAARTRSCRGRAADELQI